MPPITSNRPGARLMRIGRAKSNAALSSARVRANSVGTGSRLRSSRAGAIGSAGWIDQRTGTRREERTTAAAVAVGSLAFQDDPVEESSAVAELELGRQDIRFA